MAWFPSSRILVTFADSVITALARFTTQLRINSIGLLTPEATREGIVPTSPLMELDYISVLIGVSTTISRSGYKFSIFFSTFPFSAPHPQHNTISTNRPFSKYLILLKIWPNMRFY